jgi:glutaconate CoA-transferase subunit B
VAEPATAPAGGVRDATPEEVMTVAAARAIRDGAVCLVGIGIPSTAANLALRTHAPRAVLVYESGVVGARPDVLPLSVGDGELVQGALAVVSVPELFAYWLQGGRVDVGFLGTAQVDRFANLTTTVVGPYAGPAARLPGAGRRARDRRAARETGRRRAAPPARVRRAARLRDHGRHGRRRAVARGARAHRRRAQPGDHRPGVLEPDADTRELTLTALHAARPSTPRGGPPGGRCAWPTTCACCRRRPREELAVLRALHGPHARAPTPGRGGGP